MNWKVVVEEYVSQAILTKCEPTLSNSTLSRVFN